MDQLEEDLLFQVGYLLRAVTDLELQELFDAVASGVGFRYGFD